jgi:aspartyl aminopeptidase
MARAFKLTESEINKGMMTFIQKSPTAFHAVVNIEKELIADGYTLLDETAKWNLSKGGKYYAKRNDSGLIAFKVSKGELLENSINMVGGHTDAPALKVKPNPENKYKDYLTLAVEPYGGLMLRTWFDRDLSLAGRVTYLDKSGALKSSLVDFDRAIATVPSVAIHLNREVNDKGGINKQKEMPPLLMQTSKKVSFNDIVIKELAANGVKDVEEVLEHELFFYDLQAPSLIGLEEQFIAASRIDNLASCFIGLKSILEASDDTTTFLICNDHEECGSDSTSGAGGTFLVDILERLAGGREDYIRACQKAFLVSADNAHAVHPNYAEKHDSNHGPVLNAGPVIKINANQRYATTSETSGLFLSLAKRVDVPVQKFVARSDMGCGSTIGPITSTNTGIRTLDIGLPTFGMHSIREMAGTKDAYYLYNVLVELFNN